MVDVLDDNISDDDPEEVARNQKMYDMMREKNDAEERASELENERDFAQMNA